VHLWEKSKNIKEKPEVKRPFVTISREYGCYVAPIAMKLAEKLNEIEKTDEWQGYDKDLLKKIEEDEGISNKLLETIDTVKRQEMSEMMRNMLTDYPSQVSAYQKLIKAIRTLAIQGRNIIVGRAGVVITKGMKQGVHVRLIASESYRVERMIEKHGIKDRLEAEKFARKKDKERHDFMTQYIKFDSRNPTSYDITINITKLNEDQIVEIIIGVLKARGLLDNQPV